MVPLINQSMLFLPMKTQLSHRLNIYFISVIQFPSGYTNEF